MQSNGGLNVNQKVEAYFGSRMSQDQKRVVALNLAGVSGEKDVEARMKFIENECKKTGFLSIFSKEKYDNEKLNAVLDAFNDKSLDGKISVTEVDKLDKNSRMLVAARVVGQHPELYLAEEKAITNRAFIEKGVLRNDVQNKFKPNVNSQDVLQQSVQPEQTATRNKQYTTLPPEQVGPVQYEQLPPAQRDGGIYSSAGLAAQNRQNVTYDASMPQQNNHQVIYDKGITTGNPSLPQHLQPNVGQEAALKRAMAEVDKAPITYSQLPNSGGTPPRNNVPQGQSR